jgi:hypothetical protein
MASMKLSQALRPAALQPTRGAERVAPLPSAAAPAAQVPVIEAHIRTVGLAPTKARNLRAMSQARPAPACTSRTARSAGPPPAPPASAGRRRAGAPGRRAGLRGARRNCRRTAM